MMPAVTDERQSMTEYWLEHSKMASHEEMMLDSNASVLTQHEVPEVLSLLPDFKDKDVLELGAGIGRFTGTIADQCRSITAVDFMESFISKNKETNKSRTNVNYLVADATQLDIPDRSVDIIFTNWLLMYFTDDELREFFKNALRWLKEGGFIFFRESCFHKSGDTSRRSNPSKYREPLYYTAAVTMTTMPSPGQTSGSYGYEMVMSKNLDTYVEFKANYNQICWLLKKVHLTTDYTENYKTIQDFLDQKQYSLIGILRYEKIFGENFVSTGGKNTTEDFVAKLNLKRGQKVLDVGSGIGGSAFYMAEKFGAEVLGIDLSYNMTQLAWEKIKTSMISKVKFMVADATKYDFPEGSFDVVYSRDTILHIPDKEALFTSFLRWLKPGGKLLISDYCCSDGQHSEQFTEYVKQRNYSLLSPRQYGKVLEKVGFQKVVAEDRTDLFVTSLKNELTRTESQKETFIQEFSRRDYDDIVNGWKDKLVRCRQGDQRWGLFMAEKSHSR